MPPEKTLTLGGDLTINRLGYGAMHLTGHGMWGPPEDPANAIAVLRRAVELGINFIDTADSYGPGYNERIIREALHPYPDDLVVTTKGGMLRSGQQDWLHDSGKPPYTVALGRPEYLRQQVELSLYNLGLDCIPLYQLHRIDPVVPLADQLGALGQLQQEGKIRHIGVSGQPQVSAEQVAACRDIVDIVAVENLYNVADRSGEDVLHYTEDNDIAFIPWFPMGHGDLLGPNGALAKIAPSVGASPSQLALGWLLHHSPNNILIPGTTSINHLEENVRAGDLDLDDGLWDEIAELCTHEQPWRPGQASA
ncbi:aldo/keto reductase [Amycolatopsis antarctica]|nr:aldo/keto reductase [Amycolatopsis antarctica]